MEREFKIGQEGYFWNNTNGPVLRTKIYKIDQDSRFPYITGDNSEYAHFSTTIPDWFLPTYKSSEDMKG